MSFIPSLPISKIFQPAVSSPKRPSNNQEKVEPTKYYKKIKVISRNENDKTIIRKIDDYHTDRKTYADCHFLINQYDKILEARPIELACSAAETIIIKTNTSIEGHTERVLERLLRDLRAKYGIENKLSSKNNYLRSNLFIVILKEELKHLKKTNSLFINNGNWTTILTFSFESAENEIIKNYGTKYKNFDNIIFITHGGAGFYFTVGYTNKSDYESGIGIKEDFLIKIINSKNKNYNDFTSTNIYAFLRILEKIKNDGNSIIFSCGSGIGKESLEVCETLSKKYNNINFYFNAGIGNYKSHLQNGKYNGVDLNSLNVTMHDKRGKYVYYYNGFQMCYVSDIKYKDLSINAITINL